jgi:hypothetical protein
MAEPLTADEVELLRDRLTSEGWAAWRDRGQARLDCLRLIARVDVLTARLDAAHTVISEYATGGWFWTRGIPDGPLWWVDNEGPRRLMTDAEAAEYRAATADPTPQTAGDQLAGDTKDGTSG